MAITGQPAALYLMGFMDSDRAGLPINARRFGRDARAASWSGKALARLRMAGVRVRVAFRVPAQPYSRRRARRQRTVRRTLGMSSRGKPPRLPEVA